MNDDYKEYKDKAYRNLKYYLIFNFIFIIFNLIVIKSINSYTFPKNFFAIWPIIGWGIPTISKFIDLKRRKADD